VEPSENGSGVINGRLFSGHCCRERKSIGGVIYAKKKGVVLSEKLDAFFTEKYGAPWIAEGEARGELNKGREVLLKILRKRFQKVPKDVENTIRKMNDPVALDSWAEHALDCQSMAEFSQAVCPK